MAIQTLQTLIDKQDGFEIVRNQIALILMTEFANQQQLATDQSLDPTPWDIRVFMERANPWEEYLNEKADQRPIVNVWYDSSDFDPGFGGVVEHQQASGTFNIDIYGYGVSGETVEGHDPGDKNAALNMQRALRLVRNILMADTNTYLQLRGNVGKRWVQSVQSFQPELSDNPVQKIIASRLALNVTFNELSPQYVPDELEFVNVDVYQFIDDETSELIFTAQYDFS